MVHYEALTSTSEGVYALYAGVPWGELDKRHSSVIEFYHWDGKPVKRFLLEEPVSDIVVDEARKLIYGIIMGLIWICTKMPFWFLIMVHPEERFPC